MAPEPTILCLSDYFGGDDSRTAGAGGAALTSFEALRTFGADVHLLAGFLLPASYRGDPRCMSLDGYDLRERGASLRTAGRLIWNAEAGRKVAAALRRFDPRTTVVVLHQWTRFLSPAGLHALADYPALIYLHDYFQVCPTGAYYDFQRRAPCELRPGGMRCAVTDCDRTSPAHKGVRMARHLAKAAADAQARAPRAYVHISDASRAVAEPHLPGKLHYTIYHPLGDERPASETETAEYDVGYFGRLEPEKGLAALVAALKARSWSALFVGTGSLEGWIRQELPHAAMIGWSSHAQVLARMRRCRTVALPSIWPETWGCVTAEAAAGGVPVVVSGLAGSSELVQKYGGGLVFDPADPNGLRSALDRILGDGALRNRLAEQASRVPERAGLDIQAHARRLLGCVEDLQLANAARLGRRRARTPA